MGRSCKTCKWIDKKKNFLGEITWCGARSEETTPDGYCDNYKQKTNE